MNAAFRAALLVALAAALFFLTLPLVAILVDVGPGQLASSLTDPVARDALRVSLVTTGAALLVILAVGTPAAYLLATRRFRGRAVVVTLLELPLVLPPAVAGIALLAALGPSGVVADVTGVDPGVALTRAAVILALVFVASPFYLRGAQEAFAAVDPRLLEASRTLGRSEAGGAIRVALPVALPGLASGTALAWGRAVGEFGATIIFAGSFQGVTQTLPLAVFQTFTRDYPAALAISALLLAVSAAVLLGLKLLGRAPAGRLGEDR